MAIMRACVGLCKVRYIQCGILMCYVCEIDCATFIAIIFIKMKIAYFPCTVFWSESNSDFCNVTRGMSVVRRH